MSSPGEKTPLVSENSAKSRRLSFNNTQHEAQWWEKPQDAQGTYQHLILGPPGPLQEIISSDNAINREDSPPVSEEKDINSLAPKPHTEKKLNELMATAISGNDITSSVLYVSGFAAVIAGVYAPIALVLVAVLLALFRPIYTEVVTALPMNGGTYNALLNTTTKQVASIAGALSLLSYTATAVVSANSAMQYLQQLWEDLDIFWATIVLLGIFAALNLLGITESAIVATGLFLVHCATLLVLVGFSGYKFFADDFSLLKENWAIHNDVRDHWARSLYYGFGAAMLGITGFETSANFVEEQAPGVFPKTLRNMWIAVSFFNPVLSLFSFGLLPLHVVTDPSQSGALLSLMAGKAAGKWLVYWVSIDAVLVLSGAVLTAYVGVTGLVRRLSLDRILAQVLLSENKIRGTNHYIIIGFFLLCSSLFAVVGGQTDTLSGVYTCAFLCVMSMFALSNMMLKYKRSKLPRDIITPWPIVVIAYFGVVAAFVANLLANEQVIPYFLMYFAGCMIVFLAMFWRVRLMKLLYFFCHLVIHNSRVNNWIATKIQELNSAKVIFFTKDDNLALLNKAMLYIRDNEQTNWVIFVHVYTNKDKIPPRFEECCKILEQCWPKYRIDFVAVQGQFDPVLVDQLSDRLGVPKNFMFIATPSERFSHKMADLGGLRLVTH